MPILITDDEFNEIRAVFQDVTDTFHKKPVTYLLKGESLDIHNEDRADQDLTPYNLLGMVVWEKTSDDSEVKENAKGNVDLTHGYVNFNYYDCDAAGLIVNGNFAGHADEHDYVEFDGVRYSVIGIILIGQLQEKESLIRIVFKKNIRNNGS